MPHVHQALLASRKICVKASVTATK